MGGQVQDGASLGAGQAGGDIDEAPAQGRAPGNAVGFAGEDSGGAQQVVGDRGDRPVAANDRSDSKST